MVRLGSRAHHSNVQHRRHVLRHVCLITGAAWALRCALSAPTDFVLEPSGLVGRTLVPWAAHSHSVRSKGLPLVYRSRLVRTGLPIDGLLDVSAGNDTSNGAMESIAMKTLLDAVAFVSAGVTGVLLIYVVISFTEYAYHRYVQHLDLNRVRLFQFARQIFGIPAIKSDFHVLHHRETLDDMNIDPLPKEAWPDAYTVTVHRGTTATWLSFIKMSCIVMLPTYPLLCFLGWPGPLAAVAVLAATLLHLMAYNALHPQLHNLPNVSMMQGPPSLVLGDFQNSAFAQYLKTYHVLHHRSNAQRNFNVCCPLIDHLLGTHMEAGLELQDPMTISIPGEKAF